MLLRKLVKHYQGTFSLLMHGVVVILFLHFLAKEKQENKGLTTNSADIKFDE